MNTGERAMSVAEFGHRLGVSRASAYRIVGAGLVELTNVGTGKAPRIRITESALERYLANRKFGRRAA
jgi:predicted site-specific integrase-resolvase